MFLVNFGSAWLQSSPWRWRLLDLKILEGLWVFIEPSLNFSYSVKSHKFNWQLLNLMTTCTFRVLPCLLSAHAEVYTDHSCNGGVINLMTQTLIFRCDRPMVFIQITFCLLETSLHNEGSNVSQMIKFITERKKECLSLDLKSFSQWLWMMDSVASRVLYKGKTDGG